MYALVIIDVQNDFCPGGTLAVPDGDSIIPTINSLSKHFECVIQTQDWHPLDHSSFASSHPGKEPYDTVHLHYGEQILWPDHCVQGSRGAEFHPDLDTMYTKLVVRKGYRKQVDSYSAFYENDKLTSTGLFGYLEEMKISTLFFTGLATDFCVKWSALDAVKQNLKAYVISDAVKGINLNNSVELAQQEMRDAGVEFIDSQYLLNLIDH